MKKVLLYTLLLLVAFSVVFFYWGSSAYTDGEHHSTIYEHAGISAASPKDTLTIATYNIGYFSGMTNNLPVKRTEEFVKKNEEILISLLDDMNVDILAVQEVDFDANRSFYVDQLKTIAERNGFASSARAVNWDMKHVPFPYWPIDRNFGQMLSGQGIASKFTILKNRIEKLSRPLNAPFWYNQFYLDRLVQIAEINVGRPLIVMNLHLEAFDPETRELQAHRVVELVREYINNFPVILTGDFNSPIPFNKETTLRTITSELGLREAIPDSIASTMVGLVGTFPADAPRYKIDHVFYHPDQIVPVGWHIPDSLTAASDHLPVAFKFTFKTK